MECRVGAGLPGPQTWREGFQNVLVQVLQMLAVFVVSSLGSEDLKVEVRDATGKPRLVCVDGVLLRMTGLWRRCLDELRFTRVAHELLPNSDPTPHNNPKVLQDKP